MSAETKRIRAAVFARADGACESCGKHITEESGHMDHFFGRAKVPQAVANCWALCLGCDSTKTTNYPSAAYWHGRFALHAQRHGYEAEAELADTKIETLKAKGLVMA